MSGLPASAGGRTPAAVETAGDLLATRGRVLPATEEVVDLLATLEDGRVVRGECAMVAAHGRVKELSPIA